MPQLQTSSAAGNPRPRLGVRSRLVMVLLASVLAGGTALAQPTIPLSRLLSYGFTNGPAGGYSLRVSGINNVSSAVFTDIRREPTAGNAVQAHGGSVMIYGLNYYVMSAEVDDYELKFTGFISMPPPLNSYMEYLADLNNGMVVDWWGNLGFDGPGGTLTIPRDFEMGPLVLSGLSLTINPSQQAYGGSALVGFGKGMPGSYCPPPFSPGPRLFGGGFMVRYGRLDEITLRAANLRVQLGQTPAFLDDVYGTVGNLSPNSGRNWYVQGGLGVNVGCPIWDRYPLTFEAVGTVNSGGCVSIDGNAQLFGFQVANAYFRYVPPYQSAAGLGVNLLGVYEAHCSIYGQYGGIGGSASGKLQVPRWVPVLGGHVFASANSSFYNNSLRGNVTYNFSVAPVCMPEVCVGGGCFDYWSVWCWGSGWRTACTPRICTPGFCTPRIAGPSGTFNFRYENSNWSYGRPAPTDSMVEPWELSFQQAVIDPDTGGQFTFMNNWTRLAKYTTGQHGQPIHPPAGRQPKDEDPPPMNFFIEPGTPSAIFRLTWQNPSNSVVSMRVARVNPNFYARGVFRSGQAKSPYFPGGAPERSSLHWLAGNASFCPALSRGGGCSGRLSLSCWNSSRTAGSGCV